MLLFLKLIRIQNLLIIAFTQYMVRWCLIYPLLKNQNKEYILQFSNFHFFLLVLSTVMIAAAGYIINDYFDVRIDKVNKPERMVIDKGVKRRVAMGAHTVINVLAIVIGFYVSYCVGVWKLVFIHFICASGLWFYSTTFKRQFLIGNLVIAMFTFLVPFVVGIYELIPCYHQYGWISKEFNIVDDNLSFKLIWQWVIGMSFFAGVTTLIREMIKDIEDYEGDKEFGCTTLPIVVGILNAKRIVIVLSSFVIACLGYLQYLQWHLNDNYSVTYFLIFIQLPFLFLMFKILKAQTKKEFHLAGNIAKLIMFTGVCYLFVLSWILFSF